MTAIPATQNTAPILEFLCLYTADLRRKQKRWQDGRLKYHTFNKRLMVYDERSNFVGDTHWREDYEFAAGEELQLDRGGIFVQVADFLGSKTQDLSELLEKRVKQREERSCSRLTGRSSIVEHQMTDGSVCTGQMRPKSLNDLLGTPSGYHGKATVPIPSLFEIRRRAAVPETDTSVSRSTKRQKRESPINRSGYAQSLTGATLTLSGQSKVIAPLRLDRSRALPSRQGESAICLDLPGAEVERSQSSIEAQTRKDNNPGKYIHRDEASDRVLMRSSSSEFGNQNSGFDHHGRCLGENPARLPLPRDETKYDSIISEPLQQPPNPLRIKSRPKKKLLFMVQRQYQSNGRPSSEPSNYTNPTGNKDVNVPVKIAPNCRVSNTTNDSLHQADTRDMVPSQATCLLDTLSKIQGQRLQARIDGTRSSGTEHVADSNSLSIDFEFDHRLIDEIVLPEALVLASKTPDAGLSANDSSARKFSAKNTLVEGGDVAELCHNVIEYPNIASQKSAAVIRAAEDAQDGPSNQTSSVCVAIHTSTLKSVPDKVEFGTTTPPNAIRTTDKAAENLAVLDRIVTSGEPNLFLSVTQDANQPKEKLSLITTKPSRVNCDQATNDAAEPPDGAQFQLTTGSLSSHAMLQVAPPEIAHENCKSFIDKSSLLPLVIPTRIINPATRGRKAAQEADKAGKPPLDVLPPLAPTTMGPPSRPQLIRALRCSERSATLVTNVYLQVPKDVSETGAWSKEAFDLFGWKPKENSIAPT